MFSPKPLNRSSGFTLMELMASLALLGTLAAFAIPAFSGYTERARVNAAIADISAASIEVHRWRMNNGGAFPDTLAVAGIVMEPDPWGNAYVYEDAATAGAGTLRTQAGAQINSQFDLYSRGPDGATATNVTAAESLDDILMVRDGAFVGQAEDL